MILFVKMILLISQPLLRPICLGQIATFSPEGKALNIRSTRYKESSYIIEKQIKAHAPEGKAFCFIKIQTPKKSEPANQRGVCAIFFWQ